MYWGDTCDTFLKMHAYLIVGKNESDRRKKVEEISEIHNIQQIIVLEPTNNVYTVKSIRELKKDLSLKSPKVRSVVIYSAQNLTEEAANGFLKTLEEPGENTIYILTAPNREAVLETIASRCEVINLGTSTLELTEEEKKEAVKQFEKLSKEVGERFKFVDKIGDREEVLKFVTGQIYAVREQMLKSGSAQISAYSDLLNQLLLTKKDLESNVNPKLTLIELLLNY